MNEQQAFEIIEKVCNAAVKAGLLNTAHDAAAVYTAMQTIKPKEKGKQTDEQ